jgi:hypothetical protein
MQGRFLGHVHTRRAQRAVRLWRGQAERREGMCSACERQKLKYNAALVDHVPELLRIHRACRC